MDGDCSAPMRPGSLVKTPVTFRPQQVSAARPDTMVTMGSLLEVQRRLLASSRLERHPGCVRGLQNWIGGSDYNPCSADFVPPPPELVHELLADLFTFCNADSLPPLVQAAIAHAQFETIHPFVDCNGRTGRVLFHMVMRRRGLGCAFCHQCH